MSKNEIIEKLKEDKHYYGEFGKQYLSNSDISTLLKDPLALGKPHQTCLLYTSPSPRDGLLARMPSSA